MLTRTGQKELRPTWLKIVDDDNDDYDYSPSPQQTVVLFATFSFVGTFGTLFLVILEKMLSLNCLQFKKKINEISL